MEAWSVLKLGMECSLGVEAWSVLGWGIEWSLVFLGVEHRMESLGGGMECLGVGIEWSCGVGLGIESWGGAYGGVFGWWHVVFWSWAWSGVHSDILKKLCLS